MPEFFKSWIFWVVVAAIILAIIIYKFGRISADTKIAKITNEDEQYLPPNWSPEEDAIKLHDAFNPSFFDSTNFEGIFGAGTDEEAIWRVLESKTDAQLAAIYNEYKSMYGDDLLEEFDDELSGADLSRALAYFSNVEFE